MHRLAAVVFLVALSLPSPVLADEPIVPPPPTEPPPPAVPPPPVVSTEPATPPAPAAPALPPGVTPIQDERPVTFVLTGGNRVVARRIGEDAEFFWVETEGHTARIRKADIASVDFQTSLAQPPPPAFSGGRARDNERFTNVPVDTPAPKGRGMVIWGSIMLGLGYTAAIAGTFENSDEGTEYLLLVPIAGPFLYAAAGADRAEAGPWIIDGLLQAGGLVLLYAGIRRMQDTPPARTRHRPFLDVAFGPHGGFAQATWAL